MKTYLLIQCLWNWEPTLCQAWCGDLQIHCPCGAHSPTHGITLLSAQEQVWTSAFFIQTTRDWGNGQGHCSSIGYFSKYLKNCYFWYWFVLNLSKEDAPRISICKFWWRSRSQQRLIGFSGNHKRMHSSSSSQNSILMGGQITRERRAGSASGDTQNGRPDFWHQSPSHSWQ